MSKQASTRKPLIIGIIAAVAILAALLGILLTQCAPSNTAGETTGEQVIENADLYWNVDRAQYDGKSEGGMSSRGKNPDGYFHVRFFKDGQMMELKVEDKSLMNKIEAQDIMGLVFDDDGIVVDMIPIDKMPVQKLAWKFYVQSVGGKVIKANSSNKFDGMEIILEKGPNSKVYDMTDALGKLGSETDAVQNDRIMAVADLEGNLIAVYIYDRSNMQVKFQAHCEHCDEEVTWVEWTHEKQLPKDKNGGHFKLMNDIQLNAQQSLPADAKFCIDLNGKTVNGKEGARVLSLHNQNCEVAIMDTSEEKNGRLAAHGEIYAQGCVVWVRYGACYLYDGILDASDVVCTGRGGAAVYVPAERFFYMHGGEIIGGTAKYYYNEETGKYANGLGGAVYTIGKFVLYDGVIRDGVAQSKAVVKKGATSYQRGIGGNVYVGSKGIFEMNGGAVKNGRGGSAGNVYLDGTAEFIMNGGSITGGRAIDKGRQGGNLNIGAKATFVMNGGSITGGSTRGSSGNVYLSGTMQMNGGTISGGRVLNATTGAVKENHSSANINAATGSRLELRGGTIRGGVSIQDNAADDNKRTNLVLVGGPVIYSDTEGQPNLTIETGKEPVIVKVGNLTNRAKIGVSARGVFSQKTSQANQDNFISDIPDAEILYVDECLAVGRMACLCGQQDHVGDCDGKERLWAPWTSTNGLPTTSGNYFLATDVSYTKLKSVGGTENFVDVSLDLNGKTITSAQRAVNVFGQLNIADHVGGGKIVGCGNGEKLDHTGVLLVYTNSKLNIYGGTLVLAEKHNKITNGGVMGIGAGAVVNLYAGTIDGRTTETENTVQKGGTVRVTGTMNVHGGTVYGGKATDGGAFFVEKSGKLNILGGTVNGGKATYGGSVYVTGEKAKLTMSGGVMQGGVAKEGGNIRVQGYGNAEISGGMIMNGTADSKGGNISQLSGSFVVKGGKITGGKTFVGPSSYDKKTGEPSYSKGYGGNIVTNAAFVIAGGTVSDGQANRGGNIFVDADGKLSIGSGTVAGGAADENGGNIYVGGGKVAISGGIIDKGTALNGGAIRIQANGTVEMTGGKIQGGTAKAGGNVSLYTGTFTMSGGEVLNGTATTNNGGNFTVAATVNPPVDKTKIEPQETKSVESKSAEPSKASAVPDVVLNISGGTVSGGKSEAAKGTGGNIRLGRANAVLNLSGGAITEGQVNYRGGNISGIGVINMTGGSITKGSTVGGGGNIDGTAGALVLNLSGGKISGGIHDGKTDTDRANIYMTGGALTLSGKIAVDGGIMLVDKVGCSASGTPKVEGTGIKLSKYNEAAAPRIAVGKLTEDARILLNISAGVFAEPAESYTITETDKKAFQPVDTALSVGFEGANLKLYVPHNHCWCKNADVVPEGHTCDNTVEWDPIKKELSAEETLVDGGHYYLNWTGSSAQKLTVAEDTEVYLCLNGATIYAKKALVIGKNAQVHICDCSTAKSGEITISGSSDEPVIWLKEGNTTVNLYSGTISGNHSGKRLLTVQLSGGSPTFNMYGGKITGGKNTESGGNVRVTGQNCQFHMYGGAITGGESDGKGGNVYVNKGRFVMTGGSVTDGVCPSSTGIHVAGGAVTIGGNVAIDQITFADGKKITVKTDLTVTDPIDISMTTNGVFAEPESGKTLTATQAACFTTQTPNRVVVTDGKLELFVPHTHCWCENAEAAPEHTCNNTQVWTGISATSSLDSGYYYLTNSGAFSITVKKDQTVYLDLNGKQIRAQDVITLKENATLYICDCSAGMTGEITTTKNSPIKLVEGQTVHLLSGTINGTFRGKTTDPATASRIAVEMTGGNFYMYGGKLTSGCAYVSEVTDATKKETETGKGGNLYMTGGTATILGGQISGGKLGDASCDVILKDGSLVVGGGTEIGVAKLAKDKTIAVSTEKPLTGTKVIGIALAEEPSAGQAVTVVTGATSKDAFHSINTGLGLIFEEGTLKFEKPLGKRCMCNGTGKSWCDHTMEEWAPWDGTTKLTTSGNYYLTGPVQNIDSIVLAADSGLNIKLDLEGNNYEAKTRCFEVNKGTSLTIVNSSSTKATLIGKGALSKNNGGLFVVINGQLNLYNVTAKLAAQHNNITDGGVMVIGSSSSVVNIVDSFIGSTESYTGTVDNGGSIRIGGGQLNINNSQIYGHDVTGKGHAIRVNGGTVTLDGWVYASEISMKTGTNPIVVKETLDIDSTGDNTISSVGIALDDGTGVFAVAESGKVLTASYAACFTTKTPNRVVVTTDGKLEVSASHAHCWCKNAETTPANHTCNDAIVWTAVEKVSASSTTLNDDGYYYLNWTGASDQSLVVADNATAYLCLNGATIYAEQALTIGAGATVHICDCSAGKTGMITVSADSTLAPIELGTGVKTVYLYSGNISGSNGDIKKLPSVQMTGGTPTFYMYGGTIRDGYGTNHGGNVVISGVNANFYMHGGTITGGSVASGKHGGNVHMSKGNFYMYNGIITAGVAGSKGGNVMLLPGNSATAKFEMHNGTISGGLASGAVNAANGGNICVNATGTGRASFIMHNGTVSGGAVSGNGGNIYLYSNKDIVTINGGSVTGGTATTGPCIYNNNNGNLTIAQGATVDNVAP